MQNRTKAKALGSVLAIAALLLSGCSSSGGSADNNFPADSTMAKIAAKGKVTVGVAYDTALFSV
jgi:ABC-type amino acid transport substrate-binding protein